MRKKNTFHRSYYLQKPKGDIRQRIQQFIQTQRSLAEAEEHAKNPPFQGFMSKSVSQRDVLQFCRKSNLPNLERRNKRSGFLTTRNT